jgi:hypothetical protein
MGDLFKSLSGGIARFVFAWLGPSVIALGLFWVILLKHVSQAAVIKDVVTAGRASTLTSAVLFTFFSVLTSMLFAYTATPIYRILEGLTGPSGMRRRLHRRQVRVWKTLHELQRRQDLGLRVTDFLAAERILSYPHALEDVRPTRLGNALAAMETWGVSRYGLDSQRLWYELLGVAPDGTRRDTEEGRVPVDFFVSSIAHASVLGFISALVYVSTRDPLAALLALGCLLAIPLAYRRAIDNITDWALSVKALVNLNRLALADRLGLRLPDSLSQERDMWETYIGAVEYLDATFDADLDTYRDLKREK